MGLIEMIFGENKKKKQERNEKCRFLISCADEAMHELRSIFSAPQVFVEPDEKTKWLKKNEKVLADLERKNITVLKKADQYRLLWCARHGCNLTGESPQCGLIAPST